MTPRDHTPAAFVEEAPPHDARAPHEPFTRVDSRGLPTLSLPAAPFTRPSDAPRGLLVDDDFAAPLSSAAAGHDGGAGSSLPLPKFPAMPPRTSPGGASSPAADRRRAERQTPDRRSKPRAYASPWMARPEDGRLDPRPNHQPDSAATLIRPLDARLPDIPGIAVHQQDQQAQPAEVAGMADAPAPAVALPAEVAAPAAEVASSAAPAPAPAHVSTPVAATPAHTGEHAPPLGDPLAGIYGEVVNGQLAPYRSVPQHVAHPALPADIQAAAGQPGGWYSGSHIPLHPHAPPPADPAGGGMPHGMLQPMAQSMPWNDVRAVGAPAHPAHAPQSPQAQTSAGAGTGHAAPRTAASANRHAAPPMPPVQISQTLPMQAAGVGRSFLGWVLLVAVPAGAGIGLGLLLLKLGLV